MPQGFPEYQPMRSLIYVDCPNEQNRVKLQNWLYATHVPDSISQFGPYVTKYAFYNSLPTPPEGERFGTHRQQLTEHYWMINPMTDFLKNKALTEVFPMDVLKWQGNMPEDDESVNMEGDDARATGGDNGCQPFIFAFVPVWWEEDFKGKDRTIADGPNYRWQFAYKYPDGVSTEDGDKWFYDQVIPYLQKQDDVTRILSSKIIQSVNHCPFYRVVEVWFEGPNQWHDVAVTGAAEGIQAPPWADKASQDKFPYMKPYFEFASLFLTDRATSDNFTQYRGYITMR